MPSGKTILAAGAVLVALGGLGAGAWIASSDDEGDPAPFEHSATTASDDSESTDEVPLAPTEHVFDAIRLHRQSRFGRRSQ